MVGEAGVGGKTHFVRIVGAAHNLTCVKACSYRRAPGLRGGANAVRFALYDITATLNE